MRYRSGGALVCIALSLVSLEGCADSSTKGPVGYDAPPSFIRIRPVKLFIVNERIIWETDYSKKPAIIDIRLGDMEMREVRKLYPDRDAALKKYIEPELTRRNLCDAGFEISPGQRTGSKLGDYGFSVQCFWKKQPESKGPATN